MIRPRIITSACLEFEKVRYDAQFIPSQIIRDLMPFADFIKVCPEHAIGLGVPREPIRIVEKKGEYRLIQHKTNRDVTEEMNNFTNNFVGELSDVDGFIFKSKSPTMGIENIKVYSSIERGSNVVNRCGGFFAGKIIEKYNGYPIEEDDRLRNKKIREHFLTKLFLFARFREAKKENKLEEFHNENSLLLKYYNKQIFHKTDFRNSDYLNDIKEIFKYPPKSTDIADFFGEIMIDSRNLIEKYKKDKISKETLKEVATIFIKDKELLTQTFFNPYPEALIENIDPDRDKNYWK